MEGLKSTGSTALSKSWRKSYSSARGKSKSFAANFFTSCAVPTLSLKE